jgi:glycosyltransferase involved in cell wall biosynthesis
VAFVPPRYGDDVVGGAEAVLKEAARGLAARGWEVEVLTTCARDHFTWANEYPAGMSVDGDVTIRRFPSVISTARAERATLEAVILAGHRVSVDDQFRWMNDDLRCPEMFHYLLEHSADYRALVFAPYLFWTTFACAQLDPDRTILVPCLHDEPYAGLEIFKPMLSGSRGVWFLSEPEHQLAHRRFSVPARHQVTGAGVEVPDRYDPEGFRREFQIDGPFVLFSGRREGGKGWDALLQAYGDIVDRTGLALSLVTCGAVDVIVPPALSGRVIDLGYLSPQRRNDAMAAAAAYIQPSRYESFSRTIMEAWLAGTLVIANGASEVVSWHCQRSGAGLTYDDDAELEQC